MIDRTLLVVGAGVVLVTVGLVAVLSGGGSSEVPVGRVVREAPVSAALPGPGVDDPVDTGIADLPERGPDREGSLAGGGAATDSLVDDQQLEALGTQLADAGWTVEVERLRTVVTVRSDLDDLQDLLVLCDDSVAVLLDLIGAETSVLVRSESPSLERVAVGFVSEGQECLLMDPPEE